MGNTGCKSIYLPDTEKIFKYRLIYFFPTFSTLEHSTFPLFSLSISLRTAGSWAAWLVGACLSDRSAALDLTQLHTPFQSFCWVGPSVGTLERGEKNPPRKLWLLAHASTCFLAHIATCLPFVHVCFFFGVRVCVFFCPCENMQPLMCAKGFRAEHSGNWTRPFVTQAAPRPETRTPLGL